LAILGAATTVSVTDRQCDAVRAAVEPAVHALGLDVYDVELLGGKGARTLRLTVSRHDANGAGVDLDAITAVTQAVSPIVDRADAVNGSYLLEVSSPGVERVLRRPEHFTGAIGEQVSIKYHTSAGPRRVRGALLTADGEQLAVDEDGVRVDVPLGDVTQARTVFEWGPSTRPGTPKAGPKKPAARNAGKTRAGAKETR
jgi:ribosome maturation factor RimP